jgi:L-asparaginase/Glu-tRNA(Gln) amidotransferase subunit D
MPAVEYDVEMLNSEKVLKNILVIGFGGTIAMVPDAEGVLKPARSVSDILAAVPDISKKCNLSFIY